MVRRMRNVRSRLGRANAKSPYREQVREALDWLVGDGEIFADCRFHGNIKWRPEQLAAQALCWAWQESRHVTCAFAQALDDCRDLGLTHCSRNYTCFMDALSVHSETLCDRLRTRFQELTEEVGGRFWRESQWVPLALDGSRTTTPRTHANERAFCAAGYGLGTTARYRRKKSKGMRRTRNERKPAHPPAPQIWVTLIWHMALRLPWTWRLGPSNASERAHVVEMLREETLPKNTLFCGDAGFVGYPLWSQIIAQGHDFLVRIGANAQLLSDSAQWQQLGQSIVWCWPKDQAQAGTPPLKLRLVHVKIGKTKMWLLTSVLDRQRLSKKKIIRLYKMRWGVEVEFRGLKQTFNRHKLQCRNSDRAKVELDWAIRAMACAELLAIRAQVTPHRKKRYTPADLSLAQCIRAIRHCLRRLHQVPEVTATLTAILATALVQIYHHRSAKRARYRPPNPDKRPLGLPKIRLLKEDPGLRQKLKTAA